jgi:hypothetical protein
MWNPATYTLPVDPPGFRHGSAGFQAPHALEAPELAEQRAARLVLKRVARRVVMLFTIAVILLVLWLLGLVSGYTLGNFIYVLLVIALVLFVVGLVSGRRTV